jgi:hypothetical protein
MKTKTSIHIDGNHYNVETDEMTGAELKQLAGIAAANLLFREVHGPGKDDDEQIPADSLIHLKDGDHFYDMPQGNFGRH